MTNLKLQVLKKQNFVHDSVFYSFNEMVGIEYWIGNISDCKILFFKSFIFKHNCIVSVNDTNVATSITAI